jgi:predicted 3-demethylubiquinone-9 3-methyltransferase (glyoxalase superfamily)
LNIEILFPAANRLFIVASTPSVNESLTLSLSRNQETVLFNQKLKKTFMQKITPFLWFDNQAEEAMNFYVSVFKNSKTGSISRYGDAGPGPKGSVMVASFEIEGMQFTALNGGPHFKFTEAVSFVVNCKSQEEVDYYWEKLTTNGGKESMCGWLKDKYGLSWQIVPTVLPGLLQQKDPRKAQKVMQAMMQMKKIDINALKKAAE